MKFFALVLLLVALYVSQLASTASVNTFTEATNIYGLLKLPEGYLQHPDSENVAHQLQFGSVMLYNSEAEIRLPVQRDGSFVGYRIPYGIYLVQSEYADFVFPTVRLVLQYKESKEGRIPVIRGDANDFPVKPLSGSGLDEENPLIIPVSSQHAFYVPREEFSIGMLIKNPMVIMMIVTCGMLGMLKLFPEEELKESRKVSREWQRKLINKATGVVETPKEISDKKK